MGEKAENKADVNTEKACLDIREACVYYAKLIQSSVLNSKNENFTENKRNVEKIFTKLKSSVSFVYNEKQIDSFINIANKQIENTNSINDYNKTPSSRKVNKSDEAMFPESVTPYQRAMLDKHGPSILMADEKIINEKKEENKK